MLTLRNRDPFTDLFGFSPFLTQRPAPETGGERRFVPAVDIYETDDAHVVEVELAGMKAEDVDIEIDQGLLTLKGERKSGRDVDEEGFKLTERVYGSFTRSFRLPDTIDADNVSADLADGVLKLVLPKREVAKPRKISVKAES